MGLSGMVSLHISSLELLEIFHELYEVEDIMLQVSTFTTSAICDGDGSEKVPIVEVNPLCGQRRSLLAQTGSSNNQTMISRKFLIAN